MLRNLRDIQSIIYGLILISLLAINWKIGFHWALFITYPLTIFFAFSSAMMAHNHNHLPMFKSKILNEIWSHWLSFFYGHPIFVWVPVHNMNHHVHVNSKDDWSCTYRQSSRNDLWTLIRYHFICTRNEGRGYFAYMKKLRHTNPRKFWEVMRLYGFFAAVNLVFLVLDPVKAIFFILIPGQTTVFLIHAMNFIQHVDTDYNNPKNFARNFTGPISNFLLFNAGFHTVHHHHPAMHWTHYPAKHKEVAPEVDKRLLEYDPFWYLLRTYFFGIKPAPLVHTAAVE